jgi:hypothetical protein
MSNPSGTRMTLESYFKSRKKNETAGSLKQWVVPFYCRLRLGIFIPF